MIQLGQKEAYALGRGTEGGRQKGEWGKEEKIKITGNEGGIF